MFLNAPHGVLTHSTLQKRKIILNWRGEGKRRGGSPGLPGEAGRLNVDKIPFVDEWSPQEPSLAVPVTDNISLLLSLSH